MYVRVCVYLSGLSVERIIEFSETLSSVPRKLFSIYEFEYLICLCRHLCYATCFDDSECASLSLLEYLQYLKGSGCKYSGKD